MDTRLQDRLSALIAENAAEEAISVPMETAVEILFELDRLRKVREALDPEKRDY